MENHKLSKTAKRKSSKKTSDSTLTGEPSKLDIRKNSKDLLQRRITILKRDLKIKDYPIVSNSNMVPVPGAIAGPAAKSFRKKPSDVSKESISKDQRVLSTSSSNINAHTSKIAIKESISPDVSPKSSNLPTQWQHPPHTKQTFNSVNIALPAKKFRSLKTGDTKEKEKMNNFAQFQKNLLSGLDSEKTVPLVSKQLIRKNSKLDAKKMDKTRSFHLGNIRPTTVGQHVPPTAGHFLALGETTTYNDIMKREPKFESVFTKYASTSQGKKPKTRARHIRVHLDEIGHQRHQESGGTAPDLQTERQEILERAIEINPETFQLTRFPKNQLEEVRKLKKREKRPVGTPPKDNVKKWFTGYFFISTSSDNVGIRPDSSWLINYDKEDKNSGQNQVFPDANRSCFMLAFLPYWLSLFLTGRLPFYFEYDRSQKDYVCKINSNDFRFRNFLLSSIAIVLTCLLYNYSLFHMFVELEVEELPPYGQLELLLFDKHWISVIAHETKLVLATITSLSILISGAGFAKFITDFDRSCKKLHYDPYKGVTIYSYIDILSSVLTSVVTCLFFYFNICGLKESVELNAIIYFRPFVTELYVSWYFPYLCWVVILIQVYMLFCAKSFINMLVFYCIAVRNLAEQWNAQTARFISARRGGQCLSLENNVEINHSNVQPSEPKATHEMLFDYYVTISDLVREATKRFGTIVLVYYCVQIMDFTFAALSLGTIFISRKDEGSFNGTSSLKTLNIHYVEKPGSRFTEVLYYLIIATIEFTFTTASISSVGETMMKGSHVIRKFNLMSSKTAKDRHFILSMEMCFSRKRPPGIRPAGYFRIDRAFKYNLGAAVIFLASLMIQLNLEPFVTQPIVFECSTSASGICLGVQHVPSKDLNINFGSTYAEMMKQKKDTTTKGSEPPIEPTTEPPTEPAKPVYNIHVVQTPPRIPLSDQLIIPQTTTTTSEVEDAFHYDSVCKEFCPGTLVRRVVMYGKISKTRIPLPSKAETCVFAPYKDIGDEVVTDCRGVDAKNRDSCGMYDLNPDFSPYTINDPLRSVAITVLGIVQNCNAGTGQSSFTKPHPLELVQIPYTAILEGTLFANPNEVFRNLILPDVLDVENDPEMASLACDVKKVANKDNILFQNIFYGSTFFYKRPYGWSYTKHIGTGNKLEKKQILFPGSQGKGDLLLEQLIRPYAYLPPKLLNNKAYGYYDCFGYPLLEFDDCGYLPFSRVVKENGVLVRKTPQKERVVLADGGRQYECWESWTEDYSCGVPPQYVGFVCDKWKEYMDTDF